MKKSILVFSYYANMPGACQAEWVDDRIFAFIRKGYNITLVSGTCCFTHTDPHIRHLKTPTLSPHGARYEYEEIHRRKIPVKKNAGYYYIKCMATVDKLFEKINIRSGEGRWSWMVTSFIKALFSGNIFQQEFIFTTGGPASGHLTGIILSKFFGKKVICEFQDPLSGPDIGRNNLSRIGLQFFEKRIIRFSDCTIYCTRNAMLDAQKKYARNKHKIFYVYPGSNAVEDHVKRVPGSAAQADHHEKINMTYLGSLYQTRNLDTLMLAIDELITEQEPGIGNLAVNIYGNMNKDIRERITHFKHPGILLIHGLISRDEAMQKALEADVLLLVQNTDERSVATIPFKTYDYLHTGRLILALIYRNNEIEEMMLEHGHLVCQANDVTCIKGTLKNILQGISKYKNGIKISKYTPDFAVEKMLDLVAHLPYKS